MNILPPITIKHANTQKAPTASYTIPAGSTNTDLIIPLFGEGSTQYGDDIAQSSIWLLQHFASSIPPENVVEGTLWYDLVTNCLRVAYEVTPYRPATPAIPPLQQAADEVDAVLGWRMVSAPIVYPLAVNSASLWYDSTYDQLRMRDIVTNEWVSIGLNYFPSVGTLDVATEAVRENFTVNIGAPYTLAVQCSNSTIAQQFTTSDLVVTQTITIDNDVSTTNGSVDFGSINSGTNKIALHYPAHTLFPNTGISGSASLMQSTKSINVILNSNGGTDSFVLNSKSTPIMSMSPSLITFGQSGTPSTNPPIMVGGRVINLPSPTLAHHPITQGVLTATTATYAAAILVAGDSMNASSTLTISTTSNHLAIVDDHRPKVSDPTPVYAPNIEFQRSGQPRMRMSASATNLDFLLDTSIAGDFSSSSAVLSLTTSGIVMAGTYPRLVNLATPVNATDGCNKGYVDALYTTSIAPIAASAGVVKGFVNFVDTGLVGSIDVINAHNVTVTKLATGKYAILMNTSNAFADPTFFTGIPLADPNYKFAKMGSIVGPYIGHTGDETIAFGFTGSSSDHPMKSVACVTAHRYDVLSGKTTVFIDILETYTTFQTVGGGYLAQFPNTVPIRRPIVEVNASFFWS